MAEFAAPSMSNPAVSSAGGPPSGEPSRITIDQHRRSGAAAPGGPQTGEPSRQEIQSILAQFDAKINQMMDYPAKDVINSLTMLAERVQYAPEIVSFLETKIHRAPPNCKLPIFYLTDSILKNVRGPYASLFGRNMVPLYCNCVKQVSGKDLRRFVHVLNTWDQTRLFSPDALVQMRTAANRALAATATDPLVTTAPQRPGPQPPQQHQPQPPQQPPQQQQHDMELRTLLTQMQNDMGIHPTEHLTLEQVRVQNPAWYNQLVDYHKASSSSHQQPQAQAQTEAGGLLPPPRPHQVAAAPPVVDLRGPRRSRFSERPQAPAAQPAAPHHAHPQPHHHAEPPPKSANATHLMDLLNRKKSQPINPHQQAPPNEITNEYPRGPPNAAAVMSILQKLKGLNATATASTSTATAAATVSQQQPQQQQQYAGAPPMASTPSAPASSAKASDTSASKMWFSDKIVAHKDRVESNVQKMYAALPLVCRESGMRFKEQTHFNAHLDFLFQYNRSQKERGKGGVSRSWYPGEDQWVLDFSGQVASKEATSSSFFDRKKEIEKDEDTQGHYDTARVPADEGVTRCRICGENFAKSWDEEEEDWMYTNAVYGTIHDPSSSDGGEGQKTIFHKYCYDTVMANSKRITPEHLIPGSPQHLQGAGGAGGGEGGGASGGGDASGVKRNLDEEDSDSDDEDDFKRIKTH